MSPRVAESLAVHACLIRWCTVSMLCIRSFFFENKYLLAALDWDVTFTHQASSGLKRAYWAHGSDGIPKQMLQHCWLLVPPSRHLPYNIRVRFWCFRSKRQAHHWHHVPDKRPGVPSFDLFFRLVSVGVSVIMGSDFFYILGSNPCRPFPAIPIEQKTYIYIASNGCSTRAYVRDYAHPYTGGTGHCPCPHVLLVGVFFWFNKFYLPALFYIVM